MRWLALLLSLVLLMPKTALVALALDCAPAMHCACCANGKLKAKVVGHGPSVERAPCCAARTAGDSSVSVATPSTGPGWELPALVAASALFPLVRTGPCSAASTPVTVARGPPSPKHPLFLTNCSLLD